MDKKLHVSQGSPPASSALLEKCSQQICGSDPLFGTVETMSTMLCLVLGSPVEKEY